MIGLPAEEMARWRDRDIVGDIAAFCGFPVHLANDGSAACNAELLFGTAARALDFLYVYVGYFVGGGLVLDGSLYHGRSGNAGALASVPVPAKDGGARQLIETTSIATLERRMERETVRAEFLTDLDAWSVPARYSSPGSTTPPGRSPMPRSPRRHCSTCAPWSSTGGSPPNSGPNLSRAQPPPSRPRPLQASSPRRSSRVPWDRALAASAPPLWCCPADTWSTRPRSSTAAD